ncbi:hypothetical protein PspLS_00347 [Pyricularia sp. CBS 133598]|nr:hypothetical protein PspLS_00347 [Pyricularia sp. CBS 133598]
MSAPNQQAGGPPAAGGAAPQGGNGTTNGTATALQGAGATKPNDAAIENVLLSSYLYYVIGSVALALIVWRISTWIVRYTRQVSSLNNETQRYFAKENSKWMWFKRELQYAPIFRKRHNREIQISSAINVGTLPSRLQLVLLAGYCATNILFCVWKIPLHKNFDSVASQLRNRTGVLSVVNMVPLFLMATRNNPLIPLLGISFDTMNLMHRWFGRIVVAEAIIHTVAYMVPKGTAGMSAGQIFQRVFASEFLMPGMIGTIAFTFILFQASSPARHAFYETFKILHILAAAVSVAGVWYHLSLEPLPQLPYIYGVISIWAADRGARMLRVAYGNFGSGGSKTLVEALPDNAVRVTVNMARPWKFKPGQHAYLYFPTISWTQSHPFSVAWSEEGERPDGEKGLAMSRQDVAATRKTSISYVIRARTGATAALYKKAAANPGGRLLTTCWAEGPYGGMHSMASYGTAMLFAGGVGITQAVPHVRELVAGFADGTVAARKVVLVWIIQSPEHLEWIRPWMTEILAMERRRDVLRIMLFVSRPRSTKEIHSPSATVQMFPGRPNIETLLSMEMENQVGTVGVSVCGPGALSDEVRCAVRKRQEFGAIDFCEEAFSW